MNKYLLLSTCNYNFIIGVGSLEFLISFGESQDQKVWGALLYSISVEILKSGAILHAEQNFYYLKVLSETFPVC
jgi:hypothetical protein